MAVERCEASAGEVEALLAAVEDAAARREQLTAAAAAASTAVTYQEAALTLRAASEHRRYHSVRWLAQLMCVLLRGIRPLEAICKANLSHT
eukprot:361162-Chlamydomonas_euryale.AAC.4